MDNQTEMESTGDSQGVTLKSLLQNPFLLLPKQDEHEIDINGDQKEKDKDKEKEKELELSYDPFGNVDPMNAFLGPRLWDESMMFGDKDLKFEFMDIDEFLDEHGILGSNSTNEKKPAEEHTKETSTDDAAVVPQTDATKTDVRLPVSPQEVIPLSIANQITDTTSTTVNLPSPPRTPSPVTVSVDFELSHTDVALATIPGEDTYDPRSKIFNDDELKPQPMITKSKKVYVPDEQKDNKYWERRRKNNVAAKRSRDARRIKENQIVLRAAYLERENGALKKEVVGLKKDNMSLKSVVQKLEKELREAKEKAGELIL